MNQHDQREPASGGLIEARDIPTLREGGCTFLIPDRMPSREAVQFTISLGEAADRVDLGRLTQWMDASRRQRGPAPEEKPCS
jgi:hypothetical protein